MNTISLRTTGLLALLVLFARPGLAQADTRTVSFHLGAQCLCAQCAFDAQRVLSKIDGVRKVTLSVKQRRLDVVLDEAKRPVSVLATALAKQELGKDSALIWSVGPGNADQQAKALAQVPGVKAAKPDAKEHTALLTFSPKPDVTTAQLDAALKGAGGHA